MEKYFLNENKIEINKNLNIACPASNKISKNIIPEKLQQTQISKQADIMNSTMGAMNNLTPSNIATPQSIAVSSQPPNQIALVNFHQHFHSQPGMPTNNGSGHVGHSYLPIVRNNVVNTTPVSTTVPEFLYQLTKMLTDNNKEVIEWANGKIDVHNPHKLASDILHKYFRHSKYASFQRQLNYFGFRKLAGKGKMSPCSYVNDAATMDIRSLLTIKRKTTGVSGTDKRLNMKKRKSVDKLSPQASYSLERSLTNTGYDMRYASRSPHDTPSKTTGQIFCKKIDINVARNPSSTAAQVAIGKGVKHFLNGFQKMPGSSDESNVMLRAPNTIETNSLRTNHKKSLPNYAENSFHTIHAPRETSFPTSTFFSVEDERPKAKEFTASCINKITLTELEKNYQNSLKSSNHGKISGLTNSERSPVLVSCGNSSDVLNASETTDPDISKGMNTVFFERNDTIESQAFLQRESSLVDLAYIPTINTNIAGNIGTRKGEDSTLTFIDFPNDSDQSSPASI